MTEGAIGSAGRRRLLVIHNPVAGRRRRQRFQAVLDLLERDGDELSLRATEAPGDATRLARQIDLGDVDLRAGDLVVAAGGDGTINEVINGLVAEGRPASVPLAIVPLGTSNVLAAEIGLGRSPEAVARTIREGAVCSVSLGRITGANMPDGRTFILMAGVGVDAHAVADVEPGLKRRFAQGAYVWAGLQAVFRSRGLRYGVEVDGVRHEAASVIVAKAAHYGGPFIVAKQARLDDPRFQVCLFERAGFWPAGLYGLALALGRLDAAPGFTSVPGRKVRITAPASQSGDRPPTKPAEPVQCDGDDVARLPVKIEVMPEALSLVVPPDGPYG